MGLPPVIIHFRLEFSSINHPAIKGYPHDLGTLHMGVLHYKLNHTKDDPYYLRIIMEVLQQKLHKHL